jgi:hypothetical protein
MKQQGSKDGNERAASVSSKYLHLSVDYFLASFCFITVRYWEAG